MMKIVINDCYGGFGLSAEAIHKYRELSGKADALHWDIARDDPHLVAVVESMGSAAAGRHSVLKVVEIPDGVEWIIQEYDGAEWIAEKHRTWQ